MQGIHRAAAVTANANRFPLSVAASIFRSGDLVSRRRGTTVYIKIQTRLQILTIGIQVASVVRRALPQWLRVLVLISKVSLFTPRGNH
jgi:hypothetical protein